MTIKLTVNRMDRSSVMNVEYWEIDVADRHTFQPKCGDLQANGFYLPDRKPDRQVWIPPAAILRIEQIK